MSKHNPDNKVDAYCYEIEDKLRVLRATAKANDIKGSSQQIDLILTLINQIRGELIRNH